MKQQLGGNMAKYEADISITIEVEAENAEDADRLVLGEMTSRLLETASRDNTFQMWITVNEIAEIEESN
jgi:hypothetical protein